MFSVPSLNAYIYDKFSLVNRKNLWKVKFLFIINHRTYSEIFGKVLKSSKCISTQFNCLSKSSV